MQRSATAGRLKGGLDTRRAKELVGRRRAAGRSNHLLHPTLRHPRRGGPGVGPDSRNLAADIIPQHSNTADRTRLASATGAVGSELVRRSPHRTTSLTITGGRANLPRGSRGDHRFLSVRSRISQPPCRSDGARTQAKVCRQLVPPRGPIVRGSEPAWRQQATSGRAKSQTPPRSG